MSLLDKIIDYRDLRNLQTEDLQNLAEEIRAWF